MDPWGRNPWPGNPYGNFTFRAGSLNGKSSDTMVWFLLQPVILRLVPGLRNSWTGPTLAVAAATLHRRLPRRLYQALASILQYGSRVVVSIKERIPSP